MNWLHPNKVNNTMEAAKLNFLYLLPIFYMDFCHCHCHWRCGGDGRNFGRNAFQQRSKNLTATKKKKNTILRSESREIDIDVGGGGFHALNRELKPRWGGRRRQSCYSGSVYFKNNNKYSGSFVMLSMSIQLDGRNLIVCV